MPQEPRHRGVQHLHQRMQVLLCKHQSRGGTESEREPRPEQGMAVIDNQFKITLK